MISFFVNDFGRRDSENVYGMVIWKECRSIRESVGDCGRGYFLNEMKNKDV